MKAISPPEVINSLVAAVGALVRFSARKLLIEHPHSVSDFRLELLPISHLFFTTEEWGITYGEVELCSIAFEWEKDSVVERRLQKANRGLRNTIGGQHRGSMLKRYRVDF